MTLLIIDVGSSSVRALLMDDNADPIPGAIVRRAHAFDTNAQGKSTANPVILRELVEACIDEILQNSHASSIRAVGMATFVGNFLGVDAQNVPLTPVYTYADSQPIAECGLLRDEVDESALLQRTGCRIHTAYQPARLLWLRKNYKLVFDRVDCWLDFATYCYRHWFGRNVSSTFSVSSWHGLLNREMLLWDAGLCSFLEVDVSQFSLLSDYDYTQILLSANYASRWRKLHNVPFYLAVGDGAAANIGSGASTRGQLALTIGTTAAIRMVTDEALPSVPDGLWGYRVTAKQHLIGGATSEGGNIFEWLNQTLHLPDSTTIEEYLREAEPDAHALTFLPLLAGERSPGWRADATGTIHGLTLATTPLEIVQAGLEGVAMRLARISEQLGDNDTVIYASGGALNQSPAWAQIIANAFNRQLHLLDEPEITARGVAILLLADLDGRNLADFPPSIRQIVSPDSAHAETLHRAQTRQSALYDLLG